MVWTYRWLVLVVAAVISFTGWFAVLVMPNQYQVQTKVYIDTRSMLKPLLRGLTVDSRMLQNTALLMRQALLTRPNLEEVARRTDLDHRASTPQQLDALLAGLAKRIKVEGKRRENIYTITFTDKDPQLAKRVVEELLNTFMEKALGDTRKDTATTTKFLDEQIALYERKLEQAENALKEFKLKNVGMLPGSNQDYYSRMQQAEEELEQAKLSLREAEQRRDELQRQLIGEEPVFGIMPEPLLQQQAELNSPELAQINARLASLREQLDSLLLRYTEKHPDVQATRATIATLEKQKQAEEERLKALLAAQPQPESPQYNLNQNPVYQDLKLAHGRAEAEVAAMKTRVREYQRRVNELRRLVDTVPAVEAELKRLNRDYGVIRKQYQELVHRRETARLTTEAEKTEDIKLDVLEPPRVPLTPIGPKRLLLSSMVFAGALGAGIALAWLMGQLKRPVFTSAELKEMTGLQVIGAVSMVHSLEHRRRRRMELVFFSLGFLLLLGCYGALVGAQLAGIDLHRLAQEIYWSML